eukprot:symbB.v1.2.038005.t1/scaffold5777.1/size39392/3
MAFRYHNSFVDVDDQLESSSEVRTRSAPPEIRCKYFEDVMEEEIGFGSYVDSLNSKDLVQVWHVKLPERSEGGKPAGSWPSAGSLGHPEVCSRPCIYFMQGQCHSGEQCKYCHLEHQERTIKFDKRQRSLLQGLDHKQILDLVAPCCEVRARAGGFVEEASEIMKMMQDGSEPVRASARKLLKQVSKMTFGSLIRLAIHQGNEHLTDAFERLRAAVGSKVETTNINCLY